MAMPYPEGEVFFKRSALHVPRGKGDLAWSFNPDNLKDFASHILLEYIYNRPCNHRYSRAYPKYATASGHKYYYPSSFNVMFGKSLEVQKSTSFSAPKGIDIERTIEIGTLQDGAEYRDNVHGGPDKVTIMPIHIMDASEKYMFIDLLAPVRAIYLPLAQKVDSLDPDLCTYIMIDFRFRKGVQMWYEGIHPDDMNAMMMGGEYRYGMNRVYNEETMKEMIKMTPATHPNHRPQPFSYKEGLGLQPGRTLVVNLHEAYNLLILPRQLRSPEKGLYKPANPDDSIIRNFSDSFTTPYNKEHPVYGRSLQILDYSKVISDHFGVDVTWQPYEYKEETKSLITDLFLLGVETGLNFIPVVGPLISAGFSIAMEAINDPEEFKKNNILQLTPNAAESVAQGAKAIAKNLPKGKGKAKVLRLVTSTI